MPPTREQFLEATGASRSDPRKDTAWERPHAEQGRGPELRAAKMATALLPVPTENGGLDCAISGDDWKKHWPQRPFYSVEAPEVAAERALELAGGRTPESDQRVLEAFYVTGLRFIVFALEAFCRARLLLDPRCRVLDSQGRALPNRVRVFCPWSESNIGVMPCHKYTPVDDKLSYVNDEHESVAIIAMVNQCDNPACPQCRAKLDKYSLNWRETRDKTGRGKSGTGGVVIQTLLRVFSMKSLMRYT